MNANKKTSDYNDQILSIPYEDICLNADKDAPKTSMGQASTGIKCGDTFKWVDNNTYWIVYSQNLNEVAYFQATVRRCEQELEVNGKRYWVYLRGPVETDIVWNQKSGIVWNDLNYSQVMYVTKNEDTLDFFHRFSKFKLFSEGNKEETWEVATVNPYYGDGMIEVCINETFNNSIADAAQEEKDQNQQPEIPSSVPHIDGPAAVQLYDTVSFAIVGASGGKWLTQEEGKAEIDLGISSESIQLDIFNDKVKFFKVIYRVEDSEDITLDVSIEAF